ncbi:MAG: glycosyltransferase [Planctomycetota bacterium]|nr:MAG: glycosyltransferase [Planctomycetota bacterium]
MQTTIEVVGWILFAIWAGLSGVPTVWMIGRSLKRQSDRLPDPASWPRVSVVVPARDEGHKIEAGLKSLLASEYPDFEVIAIDDRSRDETGAIMDRLAEGQCRLRVIHITDLPEGWLGKNHALQVGARQATGEWLLFSDGDVLHDPLTLRRAVRFAVARGIDHLPLFPDIEAGGLLEAAFVACFGLIFAAGTQPYLIPTRWPRAYCGVGAFNLVRRTALDRANGFEPIKLDILDDVKLGKMLKRTGSRGSVLRAGDGLSIRWQSGAWACVTGLEKNAFASANYSVWQLLSICGVTSVVFCGPAVGAVLAGEARTGFVAAAVLSHFLYGLNAWLFGHSFWLFPMLMPSGLAFVFAFLRSGWITLRQGGVRWRDTFYPLEVLRRGVFR